MSTPNSYSKERSQSGLAIVLVIALYLAFMLDLDIVACFCEL